MTPFHSSAPATGEQPLRLLVVKDPADDAAPMLLALRRGGLEPDWQRVDTADELRAALAAGPWDAVLSDYTLPGFGAEEALAVVRAADPDLPFVVVSGAIGEDKAVALMRATASDYVLKHDLVRLAATVEREVREAGNRRARRAAERAAAHLAAVVESTDDAILSKTLDGVVTSWNPASERLFGWTAAEAVGRHVSFFIPPDKADEQDRNMARLKAGEPVGYFETVRLHRDGRRIDVAMTLSRVRDADGRLVGVSKTARDIQARKRAEGELRASEARYRGLIEAIPSLVWVFDPDGRPLLHNRRWHEYTGQSAEDTAADRWHQAIHPDDVAGAVAAWDRCKVSGELYACEYRLRRADGEYRWFLSQGTAQAAAGGIGQWVGTCTDIDDLKRSAESLRFSEARYHRLFEAAQDGVLIVDPVSRRIDDANPYLADLLGYTRAELVGKELWEIGLFRDIAANQAAFRTLQEEGYVRYDNLPLKSKDGRRIEVEFVSNTYEAGGARVVQCNIRDITARKQAEQKLRLFRTLIDQATDGIEVIDPGTGRFLDANERACAAHGYTREEYLRLGVADVDPVVAAVTWAEAVKDRRLHAVQTFESRHRRKDGSTFPVEVNFDTIRLDREYLVAVVRDITERTQAEAERDGLHARLNLQIERMPLAYLLTDADWRYTRWNPAAERVFGFTQAEVLGKHPFEVVVPPQSRDRVTRLFARLAAGDMDAHGESDNVTKSGRVITCEWFNTPLFAPDGTFQGLLSLAQDVTTRRQADRALSLRDRAMQAATQGLLITDSGRPDDPIIYFSPGCERMTGYAAAEVLGRNCRFLQGKGTDPAAVTGLRAAIAAGEPCTVELLNYRKDGTPFWNEVSVSPVRDEAGRQTHLVGVLADVTARRGLEEQFRQAQKMEAVGQLAGGVAHDFNNLLTVITGYSDLLLQRLPPGDPSRDPVAEIHKAGERSAGLTRQLLAFSRRQVLAPRVLDLNAVVAETASMLRRLIGEDVRLTVTALPGVWPVRADPGQLDQVLMNLAVNARDAMPRGGRLTIETRNVGLDESYARTHPDARPGPHVLLSVSDTGCGMPPEVAARVFEPFFTTKGVGQGTGLGLATVYGIVKQSGGHVAVYSEVGVGTTFKVYLPRAESAAGGSGTRPGFGVPPPGTETVLVVEDEDGVRALIRYVLAGCGYTVLEAADGEEAARASAGHPGPVHLLITDVVMPGAGGRAVAEQVASRHPGVRVLFVSGYTDDAVIRHGVLSQGVNFLQKPFAPAALAFKVREVLDAPADTAPLGPPAGSGTARRPDATPGDGHAGADP